MGKIILLAIPDHADAHDLTEEEKRQACDCGQHIQRLHAGVIKLAIYGNHWASTVHHYFLNGDHMGFYESLNLDFTGLHVELLRALGGEPTGITLNRSLAQHLEPHFHHLNRDPTYTILVLGSPAYLQPILDQLGRLALEPSPITKLPLWHAVIAHYLNGKVPKFEPLPPE